MKRRHVTWGERLFLLLLFAALAGVMYYQFLYLPLERELESAGILRTELEAQAAALESRLAQLSRMERELERIESGDHSSRMPSYNSGQEEAALLNSLWEDTERYSMSFAAVTREGDLVRRGFSLQFTTRSFARAKEIVSRLSHSEYRCLLSGVRYAVNNGAERDARVIVSVEGTFYETMTGGEPDMALPS